MIKKVIAFVIVLALLLVGYFLIFNQDRGETFYEYGSILEMNDTSIVILKDMSIVGQEIEGLGEATEAQINGKTEVFKMAFESFFNKELMETNGTIISLNTLEVKAPVIIYMKEKDNTFTATTIVLLDFNEE